MKQLKMAGWLIGLLITGWIGMKGYYYFFDKTHPLLFVSGLSDGGYYGGDVSCIVTGEHPYKVKNITVLLDEKPLTYNFGIGKSSFEYPFTLATRTLPNGKHTVNIKIVDGSFSGNITEQKYTITVDNTSLQAAFAKQNTDFRVFQGKTLHVQFQTSKPLKKGIVKVISQEYECFQESKGSSIYETFIPIECEEKPNEYTLAIDCIDHVDNIVTLEGKVQVVPFPFKKHSLHVDEKKVEEEKAIGESHEKLNNDLKELSIASPKEKLWSGNFYVPTEVIRISTEFGTVRATQERGLYAHKGIDIVNHPRSVIWAPQDGKVVLKDRYAYSGNTVVIDHGWGVFSLFYHLDSFPEELKVGQSIKKGNPLGKLGKTGYATGYHLHWEMRVNNVQIDPLEWTKPGF
ncbi:M23 family metallopeptidase [Candidatus Babeliales bacterium]|nr:M23 family metallopeptidase [Candidatus Babeliales bacterium]